MRPCVAVIWSCRVNNQGRREPFSLEKLKREMPTWRRLLAHFIRLALALARANTGNSIAARIPMMAITTSNSIKVNPARWVGFFRTTIYKLTECVIFCNGKGGEKAPVRKDSGAFWLTTLWRVSSAIATICDRG